VLTALPYFDDTGQQGLGDFYDMICDSDFIVIYLPNDKEIAIRTLKDRFGVNGGGVNKPFFCSFQLSAIS